MRPWWTALNAEGEALTEGNWRFLPNYGSQDPDRAHKRRCRRHAGHPADQYEAFTALGDDGAGPEGHRRTGGAAPLDVKAAAGTRQRLPPFSILTSVSHPSRCLLTASGCCNATSGRCLRPLRTRSGLPSSRMGGNDHRRAIGLPPRRPLPCPLSGRGGNLIASSGWPPESTNTRKHKSAKRRRSRTAVAADIVGAAASGA